MDFVTTMYIMLVITGIIGLVIIGFLWKAMMDCGKAAVDYHAFMYEQSIRKTNERSRKVITDWIDNP